jgi:hypothetical protein
MKEHDGAPPGACLVQINRRTMLVRQRHVRETLSDCWSDVRKINSGRHKHSSFVKH